MKTICVAIQKGGQGKTLLATHLAWYAQSKNKRVLFIDMDVQGNASYTLDAYKSNISSADIFSNPLLAAKKLKRDEVVLIAPDNTLADVDKGSPQNMIVQLNEFLESVTDDFDLCIIDTAPTLNVTMVSASTVSDFIISPMELEVYSINGVQKLVQMINSLKEVNPSIVFLGIVPNKVDFRKPRIKANYEDLRSSAGGLIMSEIISNRDSFAESLSVKEPVWKNKKSAARVAAKEIKSVMDVIFERAGV